MENKGIPQIGSVNFEVLKRTNTYGATYWSARDLQPLLGYNQWRSFEKAIQKAVTSCEQSGNEADHHFARARKPITGGKGAVQEVSDFHLSRFACYLIAQNGDPRKLVRQRIHEQERAIQTHKAVGREVREAIKRIGGTLPENLPPAEHIKQVEQRIKHVKPKLQIEGPDAKGLASDESDSAG